MLSTVSAPVPLSLTDLEWKSDLERWFDYNLDKHYAAIMSRQLPSHARFELLPGSPENTTQAAVAPDNTGQDDDPVWMKNDFPEGPWDNNPDFNADGILSTLKPDKGNWIWG